MIDKPLMAPVRVGDILWECCGVCIKLNGADPNISEWRELIAADAEVACLRELDRISQLPGPEWTDEDREFYPKAEPAARAWRSWGEPEPESDEAK